MKIALSAAYYSVKEHCFDAYIRKKQSIAKELS